MVNVFHILWDGNLGGIQKIVGSAFLTDDHDEVKHHAILLKQHGPVIELGQDRWALGLRHGQDIARMKLAFPILAKATNPVLHFHNDCRVFQHLCKGRYKSIITEHGEIAFHLMQRKIFDILLGNHYLNATAIFCVSEFIKSEVLKKYPKIKDRIGVIYNPLLSTEIAKRNYSAPFSISYIGRLSKEKGVLDLIKLNDALSEIPLFVLGDGPLLPYLKNRLGDRKNVTITGFIDDISDYLTKTSVLVVPSYKEAFNMAIIEAMAHGVPVIAYDTGGIPEIIRSGDNGWLVDRGDIKKITEIITLIKTQPEVIQHMSAKLTSEVNEKYSLRRYQAQYRDVYQSL